MGKRTMQERAGLEWDSFYYNSPSQETVSSKKEEEKSQAAGVLAKYAGRDAFISI